MLTYFIQRSQFGDGLQPVSPGYGVTDPSNAGAFLTQGEGIISNIISIITIVGGIYFVIEFVLGAFNWISAGGESGKIQKARDKMINATIGLIVLTFSYAIIGVIGSVIGLELLTPGAALLKLRLTAP